MEETKIITLKSKKRSNYHIKGKFKNMAYSLIEHFINVRFIVKDVGFYDYTPLEILAFCNEYRKLLVFFHVVQKGGRGIIDNRLVACLNAVEKRIVTIKEGKYEGRTASEINIVSKPLSLDAFLEWNYVKLEELIVTSHIDYVTKPTAYEPIDSKLIKMIEANSLIGIL